MKNIFSGIAVLFMLVFVTSCGQYPQAELNSAKAALDSAREAGADIYVSEDFNAAIDSFNVASLLVEEQKARFFSNYENAKLKLAEVSTVAEGLIAKTAERKEEFRQQAVAAISQLDVLVKEDLELLVQAPKGKEGAAALEAIKSELGVLETALAEANKLIESGDFTSATDKANAAYEKALTINEELKTAIARSSKKR